MKQMLRRCLLTLLWSGVRRKVAAERPFKVIAVTGSVGKTSTKEAIALALAASGRLVVKTQGNLGTDTGVPISLFGFEEPPANTGEWLLVIWRSLFPPVTKYDKQPYYVLEYSSDKPGDIRFLTDRLAPDIAVITKVSPVHLQSFADMSDLVQEETAVAQGVKPGGTLVCNADDPYQDNVQAGTGTSIVRFGPLAEAKVSSPTGSGIKLRVGGAEYETTLHADHQAYAVLAALAVGNLEGIPASDLANAIVSYEVPPGRGAIFSGKNGITIIDDTYNSSPAAVEGALSLLSSISLKRRSVAVLGQMNELGDAAPELHRQIGKAASGVGLLVAVGAFADCISDGAKSAGLSEDRIIRFDSAEAAISGVPELLNPGDTVLVKASQNGMRLERLVKRLLEDPCNERDLVRQSKYWQHTA